MKGEPDTSWENGKVLSRKVRPDLWVRRTRADWERVRARAPRPVTAGAELRTRLPRKEKSAVKQNEGPSGGGGGKMPGEKKMRTLYLGLLYPGGQRSKKVLYSDKPGRATANSTYRKASALGERKRIKNRRRANQSPRSAGSGC